MLRLSSGDRPVPDSSRCWVQGQQRSGQGDVAGFRVGDFGGTRRGFNPTVLLGTTPIPRGMHDVTRKPASSELPPCKASNLSRSAMVKWRLVATSPGTVRNYCHRGLTFLGEIWKRAGTHEDVRVFVVRVLPEL